MDLRVGDSIVAKPRLEPLSTTDLRIRFAGEDRVQQPERFVDAVPPAFRDQ